MYTLYYSPGACSMAIHIVLNECNQEVKLEKVDMAAGQNRSPEFLKVNPRGQVPVLVDDGYVIYEGAAQIIHITEKHNSPLLPKSGKERDDALQWLMFCNASLHPAYARVFFLMKNAPKDAANDVLFDVAVKMINKSWEQIEERLSTSPYLAGDKITAADILMTVIANWSPRMPKPVVIGPNTKKMLKQVIERPAYKKAIEIEQVEYKAAA
jgi:glutathione S-transferase